MIIIETRSDTRPLRSHLRVGRGVMWWAGALMWLGRAVIHSFFYKNLVYKNIKASNRPKIKNILSIYEGFISDEKKFG